MNIFATTICRWKGHAAFERRPGLDVLYACGEDGALAWACVRCGAKVLLRDGTDPNKLMAGVLKQLIADAKNDAGTLIGDRAPAAQTQPPHELPWYQIELVWNREFHWSNYCDALQDLEHAKRVAVSVLESGDGARVKKVRIVDTATGDVVWNQWERI